MNKLNIARINHTAEQPQSPHGNQYYNTQQDRIGETLIETSFCERDENINNFKTEADLKVSTEADLKLITEADIKNGTEADQNCGTEANKNIATQAVLSLGPETDHTAVAAAKINVGSAS